MRDDRRTPEDKQRTVGFVVGTDRFMSGWGLAPGRSLFAVPFASWDDGKRIEEWMDSRGDMQRVRLVGKAYRPRMYAGDHLSIRGLMEGNAIPAVKYN